MVRVYCGIDPGLHGGIAVISHSGQFLGVFDTPIISIEKGKTKKGNKKIKHLYNTSRMAEVFRRIIQKYGLQSVHVCVENVHSMPKQAIQAMFLMGRGVGQWEGIIAALELPIDYVTPQKWKKTMLTGGSGQAKGASIIKAQQLFPAACNKLTLKKHDGRAEAILLAEYFRRIDNASHS